MKHFYTFYFGSQNSSTRFMMASFAMFFGLSLSANIHSTSNPIVVAAPTVTISSVTSSPTQANRVTINVTFSEDVLGFDRSDINMNVTGRFATITTFIMVDAANYTFNVNYMNADFADITVALSIDAGAAQSLASEENLASNTFNMAFSGLIDAQLLLQDYSMQSPMIFDAAGNFYMGTGFGHQGIAKFNPDGSINDFDFITTGKTGISGIEIYGTDIYLSYEPGFSEHIVLKFPLATGGVYDGSQDFITGLNDPVDIAADAAGNIFVLEEDNDRVLKFGPTGGVYDGSQDFITGLERPKSMAIDKDAGQLYIGDDGNSNAFVSKFDLASGPVGFNGGTHKFYTDNISASNMAPADLFVDDVNKVLYVVDSRKDKVLKITLEEPSSYDRTQDFITGFRTPFSMTRDSNGKFYVLDITYSKVFKFDGPTNYDHSIDVEYIDYINRVSRFGINNDNSFYFSNASNPTRLDEYDVDGLVKKIIHDGDLLSDNVTSLWPYGIAFKDDFAYIIHVKSGVGGVMKFNRSDGTLVDDQFITGLITPREIAFDDAGNILVFETGFIYQNWPGRVTKFNLASGGSYDGSQDLITELPVTGADALFTTSDFHYANGNIYVGLKTKVAKFSAETSEVYDGSQDFIINLDRIGSITTDDFGNIYVASYAGNKSISKFDIAAGGVYDGSQDFITHLISPPNMDYLAGNLYFYDQGYGLFKRDVGPPTVVCKDITIYLDSEGNASIIAADVDDGSNDDMGDVTISIDKNSFTCNDLGDNTLTLTVTDEAGNSNSCTSTVTIVDNIPPEINLVAPFEVQLGATGNVSITANRINAGSTDNCSVASIRINKTTFDCSDLGENNVALTVTDTSGNRAIGTTVVTVVDNMAPTITSCSPDITVNSDPSSCEAKLELETPETADNCSIAEITNNAPEFFPLGATTIMWVVTDISGNEATCITVVTVLDVTAPTIICPSDVMVNSDPGTCVATLVLETPETADNCEVKEITNNAPEMFPLGETAVLWVVTDTSGNIATCEQLVTVEDNEFPIASCAAPFEVLLDETGIATITAEEIDAGSTDNCEIASIVIDQTSFDCSNLGENLVTLTVTDVSGNEASCTTTVTIKDEELPVALCQNISLSLDDTGVASIVAADVDGGSIDNCEIASMAIDQESFDCSNLGENIITFIVTDQSGNVATCSTTVTVEDNRTPTISCSADITVNADPGSCEATLVELAIPETSNNCEAITLSNDAPETFQIGETIVVWTATSASGNTATCEQVITVEDTEAPIASCATFLTVSLDDTGNAAITVDDIEFGSTDNCGITSIEIDQTTFDCSSLGEQTITLTVTDSSGNTASCTTIVTVEDNIPPTVITQNISVELDSNGNAEISASDIDDGSYDNCGIASTSLNITSFNCPSLGGTEVIFTVIDDNGNAASETAMVWITAPDQDGDDIADVCDDDIDGDGIENDRDNCVTTANPSQSDLDRNGIGDVCDNAGLAIPKGFSPNGDGINDTFVIGGLYSYPNNIIEIYNRWGNLVYETENYQNDWNGVAFNKSKTLPAAPYFCLINLGDSSEIIKCWVYINY